MMPMTIATPATIRPLRRAALRLGVAAGLALAAHGSVLAADIKLYPTGPSEDSSFVRFVSAVQGPMEVTAAGSDAKVQLDTAKPSTGFFPIKANADIKGQFARSGATSAIALKVKPGEFASVIALADGNGLAQVVLREEPDDFNALKSSVALYNADKACANAGLQVAGRQVFLVEAVAPGAIKRRSINPVSVAVHLTCDGKPAGEELALGQLQAGERYTVFAVPAAQGSRIFMANDAVVR